MSTNNTNPTASENSEVEQNTLPVSEGDQPTVELVETVSSPNPTPVEVFSGHTEVSASTTEDQVNLDNLDTSDSLDKDDDGGEFSMDDFAAILAQHEMTHGAEISENEVVKGRVIKITDQAVIIDVGFKSEGIVPLAEFKEGENITVAPGDEVDVFVKQLENSEGYVELSRVDAERKHTWEQIEQAYKTQAIITGRVIDRIKGGLRVEIGRIQAFLPGSQVDVRPVRNLDSFRNKDIEVRVLKVNKKRGNIVLSRKVVQEEQINGKKAETLKNLQEGIIVDGLVKNLTDYGAFIDLGGIDGLLHITDMSWGRMQNPSEMLKINDSVRVKVLKFDRDKERVSLGLKQLTPNPWASVTERFPIQSRVKGKVVSITDYGAFIELEPGIEGLVHVSEMSWSKRSKHPTKMLAIGQEVEALVLDVKPPEQRISLGIKQIEVNPWETLAQRYKVGTRIKGRVRNLTDFGAFVEIEEGIDGLVHVSDISWAAKRIKHPSDALKKNQEVEAVIVTIDVENRRLSLSIKDLHPNAWERYFAEHHLGDIVTGKVTRFANFGAFVELEEGIEGLCHVSELSDDRVDKPEDVVKEGQILQLKILKMEPSEKKIGLSVKAVGEGEDEAAARNYTSADSRMASLGELAGLKPSTSNES
ncbi:MAG: 30S ribosomal protein S1 [Acidobacteria bacterium]|nr:30S ribosomal protein S1 [Acidobacteriota bacterium]